MEHEEAVPGPCEMCRHDFDLHHVVSLWEDPLEGGVVVCYVNGCDNCVSTWAVQGHPRPEMPPEDVLASIRAMVRTEQTENLSGPLRDAAYLAERERSGIDE